MSNNSFFTESDLTLSLLPEYDLGFEYIRLIIDLREELLFRVITERVPISKRFEAKKFYNQAKRDGWLYVTDGVESILDTFNKDCFIYILKDNNLPVNGNEDELLCRIVQNLGIQKFDEFGEIYHTIKLTDLGKTKLNEYRTLFNRQYTIFKQFVQFVFNANQVERACCYVKKFIESHPFNNSGFTFIFSEKELYEKCSKTMKSNVLSIIGVPESYHKRILTTMCMFYSFGDFRFDIEIEEIYNGFEQLLINSDIVKNKDQPFFDFGSYLIWPKV